MFRRHSWLLCKALSACASCCAGARVALAFACIHSRRAPNKWFVLALSRRGGAPLDRAQDHFYTYAFGDAGTRESWLKDTNPAFGSTGTGFLTCDVQSFAEEATVTHATGQSMRHVQVPSGSDLRRARPLAGLCACIISCCLLSCGRRKPCRLLSPVIVFDPDSAKWGHLVLRDATTSEAAGAVLASGRIGSAYGTRAFMVCFGQFSWIMRAVQFGLASTQALANRLNTRRLAADGAGSSRPTHGAMSWWCSVHPFKSSAHFRMTRRQPR